MLQRVCAPFRSPRVSNIRGFDRSIDRYIGTSNRQQQRARAFSLLSLSLSFSLKNNSSSSMMRWARVRRYIFYFSSSNLFWASSLAQSTKLVFGFEFKPKYNITPAREKVKKYGNSQLSRTRRAPSFGGVSPNKYPFLCVCVPSEK